MSRVLRLVMFVLVPAALLFAAVRHFGFPDGAEPPVQVATAPAEPVKPEPPKTEPAKTEPIKPADAPAQAAAAPARPGPSQLSPEPSGPAATLVPPAPPPVASPPAVPPASTGKGLPSFDLVRVEPDGSLVVAGRAEPDTSVALLRNGEPWDKVNSGAGGQFAMTPKALPPGTHELSLVLTHRDGRMETSEQIVTVDVAPGRSSDVVVALVAPNQPTRVLSPRSEGKPAPAVGMTSKDGKTNAGTEPPAGDRQGVEVGVVEQEVGGTFYAAGTAAPGATVRLYVNDSYLATATAGPDGKWSFSVGKGLTEGNYRVRLDEVRGTDGKVLSRAEVPFDFASRPPLAGSVAKGGDPSTVVVPEVKTTTVARGDSLWRISQRIYGNGRRYIVIHRANTEQIRNPDMIYPGQVFVVPAEKTQ